MEGGSHSFRRCLYVIILKIDAIAASILPARSEIVLLSFPLTRNPDNSNSYIDVHLIAFVSLSCSRLIVARFSRLIVLFSLNKSL